MNVWEEAGGVAPQIQLHKFSATTSPVDVKGHDMPEAMLHKITRENVGKVWRARIGRDAIWSYGWSAEQAVTNALAVFKKM